jgi:hypothetical protein
MKKILFFFFPIILAIALFGIVVIFIAEKTPGKGALQVTSTPQSIVFLNGNPIGKTPLCKCEGKDILPAGEYVIRLVPVDTTREPFETKISINPSVLTVVDRTFGDTGKSSGSIIALTQIADKKDTQLFISTFPDATDVLLDSNQVGMSPLLLQHVTDSDHEVAIDKIGYAEKTVRIHTVSGYKLSAVIWLATNLSDTSSTQSATILPSQISASDAATLQTQQVIILNTPTGFLRVRDTPSISGLEIAEVHPGDTFTFIGEHDGWYEIKLTDGKLGWVSSAYSQKK